MTFSLKLVVEWRRLPHFPAKMTMALASALFSIEKISYSQLSSSSDLKLSIKRKTQLSPFCLLYVSNLSFGFQGGRLVFWTGCFNLPETDSYAKTQLKNNLFGWTGWLKDFGMTLKCFVCVCVCGYVISCCLFSLSLRENGRNNSQHCWPNNIGSCSVPLHVPYRLTGFKLNATTRNNMQQGVQTDATCNIQQCWVLLANN